MHARLERFVPASGELAVIGWLDMGQKDPPAILRWGDRLFVFVGNMEFNRGGTDFWLYRERGGGLLDIKQPLAERPPL